MNTTEYQNSGIKLIQDRDNCYLYLEVNNQTIKLLWSDARIIRDLVNSLFEDAVAELKGGETK